MIGDGRVVLTLLLFSVFVIGMLAGAGILIAVAFKMDREERKDGNKNKKKG